MTDPDTEARADAERLQQEAITADPDTLRLILTEARTHYGWQARDIDDATLHRLYDIAKMGPTSMNQQPMRVVFVKSDKAKARLEPCLAEGNREKMTTAPVTAIIAHDIEFWREFPRIFPVNPGAAEMFKGNTAASEVNAFRNATLQGAYFIIAARAVGLDVGVMSGFNNDAVDAEFFSDSTLKSNFLVNLGYADTSKIFRRLPRFDYDDVCEVL